MAVPPLPDQRRPTRASAGVVLTLLVGLLAAPILAVEVTSAAAGPGPSPSPQAPGEAGADWELIEEALTVIEERFVDEEALDRENLTRGAIRGLVEALGDEGHTTYLTPEELRVEQDALEGRVVGIGVVVDQRAGDAHVISVIDGSPADAAGIQAGDIIVSVDGSDTSRLPIDDLAALVRGEVGTRVRLGIERAGLTEPLELDVMREDVEIAPASWALVPGSDVAVVRLVQFSAQAARATREAIEDALAAGATGIVLDLRGNPGGLVEEAITVAGFFLEDGVVYRERDREAVESDIRIRPGYTIAPDVPLVVLVDFGTASSAEILAAALRDNERARIVGERTYGTGTVLNTFHLSDGSALRIAVRDWLTPAGQEVFGVGVAPDDIVELSPGATALRPRDLVGMTVAELAISADVQLREAVSALEAAPVAR